MFDLQSLYQEVILDHNARPRNFGSMKSCAHHALGHNPLCGDEIEIFLKLENGVVKEAMFQGHGCAISKASASLMTDALSGQKVTDVQRMFEKFHHMLTVDDLSEADLESLGKVKVFSGVREFPARVKCATLAWHTMQAALLGKDQKISTE